MRSIVADQVKSRAFAAAAAPVAASVSASTSATRRIAPARIPAAATRSRADLRLRRSSAWTRWRIVGHRLPGTAASPMAHAIFHVSNLDATVAAAKAAGAKMQGEVAAVDINGMSVRIATLTDPDGNVLELMELPGGAKTLPHP